MFVCLCVCVGRITAKVISQFDWNLVLWLEESINFWWQSRYAFRITFHFCHRCRIGHVTRFISISLTVTCHCSWNCKMTDADKGMNPVHFGSDPTDTVIGIWINPEIQSRIPDHFWFGVSAKWLALAGSCWL